MSKIVIECFGDEAQLITFTRDGEPNLVIELGEEYDGYISMGNCGARIKGASCALDTRRLADGEYTPRLILDEGTILLPGLIKQHGIISPKEPDVDYIRALSLRERRLNARVDTLENELKEIKNKVMGTRLFELLP